MKLFLLASTLLFSFTMIGQIAVDEYQVKHVINVDEMESLPPVTASSECGLVTTTTKQQLMSGGCIGNMVVTYTFTDDCGNKATAQQIVQLKDTTPPVLVDAPEGMTASRNEIEEVPQVTAQDNYDKNVKIDFQEEENKGIITRTWTLQDQCGNTSVHQQVIQLRKS
ncbi:MAG: hypothetical protein HRT74_05660 [Flavobacteriales bacterium]|nr:hypothetical protein [Flavobacteriales bacterium]